MNKGLLVGLGIFIAVVIAGVLFMLSPKEKVLEVNSSPQPTSTEISTSVDSSITPEESVKEIVVSATEFSFTPKIIQLKVGEKVRLTFKNEGNFPHDFMIHELEVMTKKILPGETDTIEFIPTKAGTFTFFCDVSDHQDQGMEGSVIVSQ